MSKIIIKCLFVGAVVLMAGCASQGRSLYAWGQYESLVYQFHHRENAIEPSAQISILQSDIAKARHDNMKVAPGIFAHLGMLYSSVGDIDLARAALEQERMLFPEADIFISGLLKRLDGAK